MHKHLHKSTTPAPSVPAKPVTTTAASAVIDKDSRSKSVSEEAIRVCAYCKWESAGKPDGDGTRFWLEAENELKPRK